MHVCVLNFQLFFEKEMFGQICSGESEGLMPQCKSVLHPFVKD